MKKTTVALFVTALLSGCGNSSDNNTSTNPDASTGQETPAVVLPSEAGHLIGTAATGAPITGLLKLVDAEGTEFEYSVHDAGQFDFDSMSNLKTPALLQIKGASGGRGHELYSVVLQEQLEARVVNITPLTQLLISHATGVKASEVFYAPQAYMANLTKEKLDTAQVELKAILSKLFSAAGVEAEFDLLSGQFEANYTEFDAVMDLLDIEFTETEAVITYRGDTSYQVTLLYGSQWNQELLPSSVSEDDLKESLTYLEKADAILEAMVLTQDKDQYMAYVHANASWFGESGDGVWFYKESTMGNEVDADMDRYRDLALLSVDKDNNRFEVGFTQRLEDSQYSSGSRLQAWFEEDDQGNIKFLGEETPLPISASLVMKMESYDTASTAFASNSWRIEIDAFPSMADCEKFTASPSGWEFGNQAFSSGLEDLNKFMDLDYVLITGPGFEQPFKLDKMFKMENQGEGELPSCHLASSQYQNSPILSGYEINYDPANGPEGNPVPDNSEYTLAYFRNGETSPFFEKTLNIGKGASDLKEVMPFLARKATMTLDAGGFEYSWSRESDLVTDADLWVYGRYGHEGAGYRISIENGKTEASSDSLPLIGNVFHSAYDPYGRIITRGYLFPYNSAN